MWVTGVYKTSSLFKDEVPRLRPLHFGGDPIECSTVRWVLGCASLLPGLPVMSDFKSRDQMRGPNNLHPPEKNNPPLSSGRKPVNMCRICLLNDDERTSQLKTPVLSARHHWDKLNTTSPRWCRLESSHRDSHLQWTEIQQPLPACRALRKKSQTALLVSAFFFLTDCFDFSAYQGQKVEGTHFLSGKTRTLLVCLIR